MDCQTLCILIHYNFTGTSSRGSWPTTFRGLWVSHIFSNANLQKCKELLGPWHFYPIIQVCQLAICELNTELIVMVTTLSSTLTQDRSMTYPQHYGNGSSQPLQKGAKDSAIIHQSMMGWSLPNKMKAFVNLQGLGNRLTSTVISQS